MTPHNTPQVKQPSSATWDKTQKLGANLSWIYVCVRFLPPGKLGTSKLGTGGMKYKGLRRVIFSYVLTDGAWSYLHATDPLSKGTFRAI